MRRDINLSSKEQRQSSLNGSPKFDLNLLTNPESITCYALQNADQVIPSHLSKRKSSKTITQNQYINIIRWFSERNIEQGYPGQDLALEFNQKKLKNFNNFKKLYEQKLNANIQNLKAKRTISKLTGLSMRTSIEQSMQEL